jgi:hypothetical protein
MFAATGVALSLLIPPAFGIRDLMGLLLAAAVCVWPAIFLAYTLTFKIMPPKYEVKNGESLTLLR